MMNQLHCLLFALVLLAQAAGCSGAGPAASDTADSTDAVADLAEVEVGGSDAVEAGEVNTQDTADADGLDCAEPRTAGCPCKKELDVCCKDFNKALSCWVNNPADGLRWHERWGCPCGEPCLSPRPMAPFCSDLP